MLLFPPETRALWDLVAGLRLLVGVLLSGVPLPLSRSPLSRAPEGGTASNICSMLENPGAQIEADLFFRRKESSAILLSYHNHHFSPPFLKDTDHHSDLSFYICLLLIIIFFEFFDNCVSLCGLLSILSVKLCKILILHLSITNYDDLWLGQSLFIVILLHLKVTVQKNSCTIFFQLEIFHRKRRVACDFRNISLDVANLSFVGFNYRKRYQFGKNSTGYPSEDVMDPALYRQILLCSKENPTRSSWLYK